MLNRFPARTSRVFPEPRRCLRYASTSAAPLPEATMPMPALPPEILQLLSDDGLIQTVSNAFLHLPELSHTTYAGSVVLLVLALRSTFTLPVNLWQRRRTDRMQQLVMPKMNAWALQAREELRKKCRRQGKSYEEYVAIYNQATKIKQKALEKEHACQPRRTLFAPLAVHLPVFMLATTAIRDACIRATAFKTHIFQSTFASNQSQTHQAPNGELIPGMADLTENQVENAKLLLQLSNETLLSDNALLIHADPSYGLPMLVGLTLLFNTELSASIRAQFIKARAQSASPASPVPPSVATNAVTRSSGASRNVSTQFKKTARPLKVDSPHRRNHQQTVPTNAETDTPDALQVADSKFTPALRLLSIGMIVVATQAPMAVNLYWITSNLFTLVQNSAFALIDRSKRQKSQ